MYHFVTEHPKTYWPKPQFIISTVLGAASGQLGGCRLGLPHSRSWMLAGLLSSEGSRSVDAGRWLRAQLGLGWNPTHSARPLPVTRVSSRLGPQREPF